ncbi:hypothetical protein R1sor_022766 [Riccia sorocarpa]|uniref:Uncharacterized protein n=1 Tax=Riccia sorocarpa TaxID=122646 RepID=A0ABD3GP49_9MARC
MAAPRSSLHLRAAKNPVMATTNVVRIVVGNSPAAADSGSGAGAGAEAAIAAPMLETATAATKVLAQADLMAEAILEFEEWNYCTKVDARRAKHKTEL